MKPLFDGIIALFKAAPANTFYTQLSGRLYPYAAEAGTAFPYATYELITDVPDQYFGGEVIDDVMIQISMFAQFTSGGNPNLVLNNLFTACKSLYDDCTLTVTGYDFLKMMRQNSVMVTDPIEKTCAYHVEYIVQFET